MNKKIIAFGASNSLNSINKQFASYTAQQIEGASYEVLDLNDYEMPLYSIDREKANGVPSLASDFIAKLAEADGFIISFAEHNGNVSVAYKNLTDWVSRIERNLWQQKPMLLLSTSPGGRGGAGALDIANRLIGFANPNITGAFSLPSFHKNFNPEAGISDPELATTYQSLLQDFSLEI